MLINQPIPPISPTGIDCSITWRSTGMQSLEAYQTELRDALAERDQIDLYIDGLRAQIRRLGGEPEVSVSVVESAEGKKLASNASPGFLVATAGPLTYAPKLNDLIEIILRKAGKPLYGTVLANELAKVGRPTSSKSITSMVQDTMNRFEALGKNTWALREWPEEVKAPFRRAKRNKATPKTLTQALLAGEDQKESGKQE
jgi:hypothetical protein